MGYPASGVEGLYRNRREDVKKFLEHRHGQNFWVFNFCPVRENSYPPNVFDGRVSRYPYPDHHAPPLAILPLAAREIRAWLDGSAERVAVLHCKAGKGRSGTLACSYLLSLDENPIPPRLQRGYNAKQWAAIRADQVIEAIPDDNAPEDMTEQNTLDPAPVIGVVAPDEAVPPPDRLPQSTTPAKSFTESLKEVLDLHTSQRMKGPSSSSGKVKQGVSIPSQRRWLYYWALLLAHQAPSHLWALSPSDNGSRSKPNPKVRLTEIKLRMKEVSGVKIQLVRAASLLIGRTNFGKQVSSGPHQSGNGYVWVSLARYDDELVESLENLEKLTREADSEGGAKGYIGKRNKTVGVTESTDMFKDGRWDKGKMVRSFARMGTVGNSPIVHEETEKNGKIITYMLRPLSDENWVGIRDELQQDPNPPSRAPSEANSMYDVTETVKSDKGIILDAGREVRVKLYMDQIFMGWFWFIPTFHMPNVPASSPTHLALTRKEIDFPIGIGGGIIHVDVSLEWSNGEDAETGIVATVQAVTTKGIGDTIDAKQAAED